VGGVLGRPRTRDGAAGPGRTRRTRHVTALDYQLLAQPPPGAACEVAGGAAAITPSAAGVEQALFVNANPVPNDELSVT
jgi:hypothetical protein